MTLLEVLLSGVLFLLLLTSIFALLTQSVRLLEPRAEDGMSEVLLFASKLRADLRSSERVALEGGSLRLEGSLEERPFVLNYAEVEKGVRRTSSLPEMGEDTDYFLDKEEVRFELADGLVLAYLDVEFGERRQTLIVKGAAPVEP